jgi:malic enzyme
LALGVLHCSFATANAQSGGTQALTKEDLNRINKQPLVPPASNPAGLGKKEERKPSFEYTETTGTQIREYRESNLPTEIEVKSTFGTYEMSPPQTVFPTTGSQQDNNLLSVPSIRIPLK